jgi:hypothetical protein
MINKLTGTFSKQDEEVLESCCLGVCDALESKFTDLLTALTALNSLRKGSDAHEVNINKEIRDLTSLHQAFLAKLEQKNQHTENRYMKINEPGNQAIDDTVKRKRRSEYAETIIANKPGVLA